MREDSKSYKAAKKAAMMLPDRGEPVSLMDPLTIAEGSRHRGAINELAFELASRAAGFRRSLPPSLLVSLAALVRAMNCYYSNLIEGHDTHPVDIERAMKEDYSRDPRQRDLQLEARAHIAVQRWIDEGGLKGRVLTADAIREAHLRLGELLPDDLLIVEDPDSRERIRVVAGELRRRDVMVGNHLAISPGAVPRFVERYERTYSGLGRAEAVIAAAAAHHRLLWIHPFLDGNGRVARLVSHALLVEVLDSGAVWSVARGLARNEQTYKRLLSNCDLVRRDDLDGRGNLSEEALAEFTKFFLTICIDQVVFMEGLMQPDRLRARILVWAEEEIQLGALPRKSGAVLGAVLYRGELPRDETPGIIGGSERSARRVIASLIGAGVLHSESTRAPLKLAFPAALASRWMPGLFPEQRE